MTEENILEDLKRDLKEIFRCIVAYEYTIHNDIINCIHKCSDLMDNIYKK